MRLRFVLLVVGALATLACGCRSARPVPLPSTPPALVAIPQGTGPEYGWPPRPAGRTDVRDVPWTPGALTDELIPVLRAVALADSRVRTALGGDFAYISAAEVHAGKTMKPQNEQFRLTYYSYSRAVAVNVFLQGQSVTRVADRPGYQPPAGREEIARAIELARRDPRVAQAAANLGGDAMYTESPQFPSTAGHRVFYIAFSRPESNHTLLGALVDLTTNEILSFTRASGDIP